MTTRIDMITVMAIVFGIGTAITGALQVFVV
jgi:hypothetical protein